MKKYIGLVVVLLLLMTACGGKASTGYETIGIDEVQEKMDAGYDVLDVREVEEFEEGHIIGALNKPLSELKNGDLSGVEQGKDYVVICRSGNRSQEASQILYDEKFNVLNVEEGMSSWVGEIE